MKQAYIHIGCGVWDNLNLCLTQTALNNLNGFANYKFDKIAGGHDFNAWPQLFAIFAKDYVWQRGAFVNGAPVFTAGGESQSVDENRTLTFGVEATDPDGDALTYTASDLPAGRELRSCDDGSSPGRPTTPRPGSTRSPSRPVMATVRTACRGPRT